MGIAKLQKKLQNAGHTERRLGPNGLNPLLCIPLGEPVLRKNLLEILREGLGTRWLGSDYEPLVPKSFFGSIPISSCEGSAVAGQLPSGQLPEEPWGA